MCYVSYLKSSAFDLGTNIEALKTRDTSSPWESRRRQVSKMKTFLVALCFAAFVAHIRADALDEYLMEDEEDGEPDRHPYIVSLRETIRKMH